MVDMFNAMNTDQIAADLWDKLALAGNSKELALPIIKSACEKAKLVGWKEGREHLRESLKHPASRAAHGAIAKLLSALREIASYDLNCAHETIAQAAIEDYEKSQLPTPDTDDTKRLDGAFLRRMSAELYANDKRKGGWEDWRPTIQEVWSEITHHYNKLQQALLYNRDHQELCADLANLCMKLFSLPTPTTASEEVPDYRSDKIARLYNKPDSATAIECTCDNANGLHWGRCPINLKRKPESAAESEIVPAGEVEGKYHGQFDMKPDSASTGKALTPKQCAEQFRLYAKSHPSKDSQHSLRFCADFLDEYCVATPSDSASTGMDFAEQIAERICDLVVPAVRREQAFPMPELVIILQEAFVHVRKQSCATASEQCPKCDQLPAACKCERKPDSASTGKLPHEEMRELRDEWDKREPAATPSGGGEWTVKESGIKGDYNLVRKSDDFVIYAFGNIVQLNRTADAHNAALRDKQKECDDTMDAHERKWSDCGNDTKRLDWVMQNGGWYDWDKELTREFIDKAIDAAMSQTKEGE